MGGTMPDACGRCHAFLVGDRPDCPFCGAVIGETGTTATAPGPVSAAPQLAGTAPGKAPRAPRKRDPWRRTKARVLGLGIGLMIAGVGGLGQFMPKFSHDKPPSDAVPFSSEADRKADHVTGALQDVCASKPKPIDGAAPYEAGSGPHRIELMVIPPSKDELGRSPERRQLSGDGEWDSPEADEDVRLEEVDLVACFIVTSSAKTRCVYARTGQVSSTDIPLWKNSGRLVLREAATGKEVLRTDVAAPGGDCPDVADVDTEFIVYPDAAVHMLLLPYRSA